MTRWTVDIISDPTYWVCLGIIGANEGISENSYNHPTSYGWACAKQVYIKGVNHCGSGGWVKWQVGDRGIFTYDPLRGILYLFLERIETDFSISTGVMLDAFIHCSLYHNGTEVRFGVLG